jgi:capsule polysaccharide export protein KpsE/RkpR
MYDPSRPPEREGRYQPPEAADGRSQTLALLWRERRFLWGAAWKAVILACLVTALLPNHYDGVTEIVPGENQGGGAMGVLGKLVGGASGGLGGGLDPTSLLGLKTPGAFYIEVMKSRTVQDRLIDRFDLRHHYSRIGRWFPSVYKTRVGRYLFEGDYYRTRKDLKSFTDFDEDKKSGVITLTYTDYDRQTAAKIANAYVEELNTLAAQLNTSDAHRERMFLEERLKSAKEDLDQASLALSQFSSKNAVMDPQSQSRTMVDAAGRLQGELIASETELKVQRQIYSDENIKVRTTKARIAELQSQLQQLMGSSGTTPADAGAKGSQPYPSMRALPMLGYQYSDLYRQTKIQEAVYEFLTQQYEMARIQEAKELPTVRVVDLAVAPERKSGPIRSLIVILTLVAAVGIACFWVIWRSSWEQLPADDSRRVLAAEMAGHLRASVKRMKVGAS